MKAPFFIVYDGYVKMLEYRYHLNLNDAHVQLALHASFHVLLHAVLKVELLVVAVVACGSHSDE
ncbi:Uncharacterised protein [Streptococcus pneumoniae]|nr:Uncharacterised protein [Streptococcus pneumoniae]